MRTGVITAWVLVYDDTKVLVKQYNDKQETVGNYNIETFGTEGEMNNRIIELNLIDLVEEEV